MTLDGETHSLSSVSMGSVDERSADPDSFCIRTRCCFEGTILLNPSWAHCGKVVLGSSYRPKEELCMKTKQEKEFTTQKWTTFLISQFLLSVIGLSLMTILIFTGRYVDTDV